MKKLFTLLLAAACFAASAQLDDGSIAPDFVATDIDGNEHHLYSYLEQGKSVILCFMATWSGPDYDYHSSGVLQNVYEDFGPEGTDQLVVLLLESDNSLTTLDDLYGVGSATVGNFVEGISYPIIDNAESIFWNYGNTYYPTIYAVCPDMTLVESGQSSYSEQVNLALDGCGNFAVGCTDPAACNYSSVAAADDGSCDYCFCGNGTTWVLSLGQCVPSGEACGNGTIWDEASQTCIIDETYCSWQPDSDGDQLIGVSDLLMFLSVFGDTDLDQDGIFDSNDDCVGEYDECGVCNGSGPSIPIIESIEIFYDSVYAEQIDEWLVYEYADTTFSYTCFWECGMPVSYYGYEYETVLIDEQCWFSENLRVPFYRNGDSIATDLPDSIWASTESGAYGLAEFPHIGLLYNWYAVNDERGLCPSGWSVPSTGQFNELSNYAHELSDEFEGGRALKTETDPPSSWNGTNETGFAGLPTGLISGGGGAASGMAFGLWRTRQEWGSDNAQTFRLYAYNDGAGIVNQSRREGQGIRCIKDTE